MSSPQARRDSRLIGKVAAGGMAVAALLGGVASAAHADPVNSVVLTPQHSPIAALDQKVDHIVVLIHVPHRLVNLDGYKGNDGVPGMTIHTVCPRVAGGSPLETYRTPVFKGTETWSGGERYALVGLGDTPFDMPHEKLSSCAITVLVTNASLHAAEFARSTPVPQADRPTTISAVFLLKQFAY